MTRYSDEEVSHYSKTIEVSDTGIVFGSVYAHAKDGHCLRRVGHKSISFFPFSIEKRAKKLHEWADEHIKVCSKQEVQKQSVDHATK